MFMFISQCSFSFASFARMHNLVSTFLSSSAPTVPPMGGSTQGAQVSFSRLTWLLWLPASSHIDLWSWLTWWIFQVPVCLPGAPRPNSSRQNRLLFLLCASGFYLKPPIVVITVNYNCWLNAWMGEHGEFHISGRRYFFLVFVFVLLNEDSKA